MKFRIWPSYRNVNRISYSNKINAVTREKRNQLEPRSNQGHLNTNTRDTRDSSHTNIKDKRNLRRDRVTAVRLLTPEIRETQVTQI